MTWRKTGSEFDDQCADVDLTDHAYRTHMEAIGYVYKTEAHDCRVNKGAVRRFATSARVQDAIKELMEVGFWADRDTHYEVLHHADVIHDSLDAQKAKRERDRAAQKRSREKKEKAVEEGSDTSRVSDLVSADTRQTDRQTDKHLRTGSKETCQHGVKTQFWTCANCEQKASA